MVGPPEALLAGALTSADPIVNATPRPISDTHITSCLPFRLSRTTPRTPLIHRF